MRKLINAVKNFYKKLKKCRLSRVGNDKVADSFKKMFNNYK